jgi:iron(III) transport system substrate-binding protein
MSGGQRVGLSSVFFLVVNFLAVAAAVENKVVIISPHNEAIRFEFGSGFAKWHRRNFGQDIKIDWRDIGGSSDSLRFVQSEFAQRPAGIGIDVFFGGGQEPFILLSDKKLAQAYQPPAEILEGIPQSFNGVEVYDRNYTWFGAALSSFGILQNTRLQHTLGLPLATRWERLAEPGLFGWVGAGDPRNSGTMNTMFETFLQAYGWEKGWQMLTQLAGNVRRFDRVSSSTAKDVTLGETAYALAIDFYGFTQVAVAGRSNLTFVLPQDFTSVNPDGIAILKGAPNLIFARRFIDFVLGEDGQKLWFLSRGHPEGPQRYSIERMSIRPDFYRRYRGISNIEFSPFELKQTFVYDPKLARDRREVVAALAGALLIDTHTELKNAWRSLVQRGLPLADLAELGRTPATEAEALKLAAAGWKSAAFRNQKKIEWQIWAQQKYRRIAEHRTAAGVDQQRARALESQLH